MLRHMIAQPCPTCSTKSFLELRLVQVTSSAQNPIHSLFSLDYHEQRPSRQTRKPMQKQWSALSLVGSESSFTPALDVELKLDAVTKLQTEFEAGVEVHDTLNVPVPLLSWRMIRYCRSRTQNPSSPFSKPAFVLQTNTSQLQLFRPSLRFSLL